MPSERAPKVVQVLKLWPWIKREKKQSVCNQRNQNEQETNVTVQDSPENGEGIAFINTIAQEEE